ncbi:2-(hydroxymethyl)glutarate dehydrogenase [Variovorax sp. PBL-H6]|uniref:NAD(P)-dependent oxidoreductase n=1 Tax=Variovorax sp. PBL-H6 TaxID=434009 RepID=UPI001318D899|nr:NAD(P)-dependent oxidoreductase [Variovorax sp. PBL-H6]VTU36549.1 2-(hydroxymethyl)glutarate dehydrogenase [Variovorax sp. PBL-H6]
MNTKPKVGFIGLGAMGRGAARNLLAKGFDVVGCDLRSEALDWLRAQGGTPASSLADMAAQVGIVVCFVVNSQQTEAVLFGDDALVGKLPAGTVFIACSTMDPAYVRALERRLEQHAIWLVDAPVTGGAVGAERGTLTIMGSGAPEAFELARPVLETFGARVHYLGVAGSGAQMKVLNQLLCGVHLAAAGEALALAKRQGLPLEQTLEILCSGAAGSWMLADRGPRMIAGQFDNVTSAMDIFVKDMSLVLDATRESRYPAALAHAAYLAFLATASRGLGALDDSAVTMHYEIAGRTSSFTASPAC